MKQRRPFGVTVIVILQLIEALAVFGVLGLPFLERVDLLSRPVHLSDHVIVSLSTEIISVVIAIGLWRMYRWAWVLIMVQLGIIMALDLVAYFSDDPNYLSMLRNIIIVFYLNQTDVRATFMYQRVPSQVVDHSL
jgi:uncharacterized membrane protein (DUF2068 family)